MRGSVIRSRAYQPVREILSSTVSSQVWGVIIGVGNQSFAESWELVGAGTRAWEVSCSCLATVLSIQACQPICKYKVVLAASNKTYSSILLMHTLCQYGAKY